MTIRTFHVDVPLAAAAAALALLLAALQPAAALAQEVVGRLVSTAGAPVPWALVRLVDPAGADVAGDVTTATGTFVLSAPGAGSYRVRAERIGFQTTLSEAVELVEAETYSLTLTATDAPIMLERLEVSSGSSCGLDPEEGSDLLAVWTEVEKALELQVATEESGLYSFRAEVYDYVRVDLVGRPTNPSNAAARTYEVTVHGSSGFYAFDPEILVERGFRWEGHQFFAPDARTLLSESFQTTHCYRPRKSGDRIGLAFEPRSSTGDRVDVEGTLWLDAVSGRLQTLEYRYVSTRVSERLLDGGFLEFEQLPEGAWIVRRWWIREPDRAYRRRPNYFREGGGRILTVWRREADWAETAERLGPVPRVADVSLPPDSGADAGVPVPAVPAAGARAEGAARTIALPEDVAEGLSLYREPPDSAGVEQILASNPGFTGNQSAPQVAARVALWRRAGQLGLAREQVTAFYEVDAMDPHRGLVEAERARLLFAEGHPAEAASAFRTACATGDSLTLESLWTDLRSLATSDELTEWGTRASASRCALLGDMLADRAFRAGVPVRDRLAVHYERLQRARTDWWLRAPRVQGGAADSLGRHPDIEFDDRGFIYVRMGDPDEEAFTIGDRDNPNAMGNPVVGWRYDRPQGNRIYFFSPLTIMGVGVADYRLLDAAWRAIGVETGATQLEVLIEDELRPFKLGALSDLYLSFQGLDPRYTTLAYRAAQGGTQALQIMTRERQSTMADVRYAADSIPDAPDLEPSLGFAWERLRFFDPSSGSTTVWLLAGARAGDLVRAAEPDGSSVYRVDLMAAVRYGTAVTVDSMRTVVRLARELGDDDAVVARIPLTVGPGGYPFTLVVRDANAEAGPAGNWSRGLVTGLAPAGLPEISDLAVATDSGSAWTRDGVTFLAVGPGHMTGPDGEIHVYFEVYGLRDGGPYSVEVRVVPEDLAARIWEISPGEAAFRLSFESEMPVSGGIGSHHLRLDLSDSPSGSYTLGVRIMDTENDLTSLPTTTPILRPD